MTPDPRVSLRLLGENMEHSFFCCMPWRSLVEIEEGRVLVGISKQDVPKLAVCDPVTERWSIYEIVIDASVAGLRLDPVVRVGQPVSRRPGRGDRALPRAPAGLARDARGAAVPGRPCHGDALVEAYREHVIRPNASDRRDQEHLCDGASHESVRNSE